MAFIQVFLGEPRDIAADFERHYRGESLAVLDANYTGMMLFGARSWPTYVVADADGKVIEHAVGLYKSLASVKRALQSVATKDAGPPPIHTRHPNAAQRETAPRIAIGGDGRPWVAFESSRDQTHEVRLARPDGDSWTTNHVVSAADTPACAPDLAVAGDGTVWVVWCAFADGRYDIFARSLAGGKLTKIQRVTKSDDDAMRPAVAVAGDGRVWVTYYRWNRAMGTSRDRDIFARWFDGEQWSEEIRVSPAVPRVDDHSDPDIVADPVRKDRVWIAWSWDYHSSLKENTLEVDQPTIFIRSVTPMGPDGDPKPFPEGRYAIDLRPQLAVDAGGRIACAFETWNAFRRALVVFGGKDGAFARDHRQPVSRRAFSAPSVAFGAGGKRVLAWQAVESRKRVVKTAVETADGYKVTEITGGHGVRLPSLADDGKGSVWLAYEEADGQRVRVRVKRVVP